MKNETLYLNGRPLASDEGVRLTSRRGSYPAEVRFSSFSPVCTGDGITLFSGKNCIFKGKVFSVTKKNSRYTACAYDLLRYFSNKTTFVYENRTAGEVLKLLCLYNELPYGTIADTKMKISRSLDDVCSLFSIMDNALTLTASAGFGDHVLFDDCGGISLLPSEKIVQNVIITPESCTEYRITESIDEDFYNSVHIFESVSTGRKLHTYEDEDSIRKYGRIVFSGRSTQAENAVNVAKNILSTYSKPQRTINCRLGYDIPLMRAGAEVLIRDGGEDIRAVCEKAEHIYGHSKNELLLTLSAYTEKEDI